MSNLALVGTLVGALVVWFVFREQGVRRLLLVAGVVAIGLLIYLVWSGRLSISEVFRELRTTIFGVTLFVSMVVGRASRSTGVGCVPWKLAGRRSARSAQE